MASAPFAGGLAATHHDMEAASAAEPFDNTDTSATSGDEEDDVSGGSSTSSKLSMKGSDRDLSMTKAAAAAGGSNKKAGMMLGVEGRAPDASDTGGGLLEPVSPGLGVRGKKRERRKISGFKRESPLAYREFLTGHLDATGRDSVYPSTHENDKKKRGAECLRDDATELQILMSAPRVSHIAASVENVPEALHHPEPSEITNSLPAIKEDTEKPGENDTISPMDIEITLTAAPTEEHSDAPQNDHHDRRGRRTPSPVRGEPSTLPPCIIDIPQPKLHRSPSPVRAIPRSKFPFPLHPVHDAQEAFRNRHGDVLATQIRAIFSASTPPALNESQFQDVTVACQAPRYFNRVFFHRCGGKPGGVVTLDGFERFWNTLRNCADVEEMCFWILGGGKSMLTEEDFGLLIQDVVHNHPGLEFLKRMDVFQLRYVETIIARIFYSKTRNTNPRMSLREFRKDRIYHTILNLQQTEDINASRDVFSYKHFYVIYCKFWELDSDHDLFIMEDALRQYENGCLSHLAVSRIFSGAGRGIGKFDAMSYKEFIRFILAVEDKDTPQGIEYWFRCLDTDGDGVWSLWELKMFYEEQRARMREFRMADPWDWDDFSCAILDLVNPVTPGQIRLSDLKRCKSAGLVFDMLFDIRKYDLYLRRIDPSFREWDDMYVEDRETKEKVLLEGWDKFAERAYEELAYDDEEDEDILDEDELDDDDLDLDLDLANELDPSLDPEIDSGSSETSSVGDDDQQLHEHHLPQRSTLRHRGGRLSHGTDNDGVHGATDIGVEFTHELTTAPMNVDHGSHPNVVSTPTRNPHRLDRATTHRVRGQQGRRRSLSEDVVDGVDFMDHVDPWNEDEDDVDLADADINEVAGLRRRHRRVPSADGDVADEMMMGIVEGAGLVAPVGMEVDEPRVEVAAETTTAGGEAEEAESAGPVGEVDSDAMVIVEDCSRPGVEAL